MRRVVIFTFPGTQSLDVAGPLEVFMATERTSGTPRYTTELIAPHAGPVRSMSGLGLVADAAIADVDGPIDTFVVAGGDEVGIGAVIGDPDVLAHVRRLAAGSRRVVSVCSGAFVLAAAGLLDGRRATTHWSACDRLARHYPAVTVERDPIFVRDGKYATSAGVTSGIDLALALVEDDHGHAVAMGVARQLVVFLKRPGGQAQFSAALATQVADRDDVSDVQSWIADHLGADLSVAALARRAAMSPRHFARVFRAATGATPARYVEQARVEAARRRLEESDDGVDAIATACGFGTAETMRRTFLRALHVAPTDYRRRFRSDGSAARDRTRTTAPGRSGAVRRPAAVAAT
jgi:transcriptional regulator GlxA family with amidase domain